MTKWPIQKQTRRTAQQHAENQDATGLRVFKNDFLEYTLHYGNTTPWPT